MAGGLKPKSCNNRCDYWICFDRDSTIGGRADCKWVPLGGNKVNFVGTRIGWLRRGRVSVAKEHNS